MEPIQTMIKFVDSGSSNVQNSAATGDTLITSFIISAVICAVVALGLVRMFRLRPHTVGKHAALLTQNVRTKVIAALFALMAVVLLVVGITSNVLSAKASQSNLALASETIEATVDSNTGAITFEDGWIKSASQDAVYFEGMLVSYTNEVKVTESCNWQIAIDDKTVYEGNPGKDIDGAKSIEFTDSKLSIAVSNMGIETAKQLIGKNVLQLSFYVFDKNQDVTAKEIEKATKDFNDKISDASQFPPTALLKEDKDELITQLNALKLEFEAKVSSTTDPTELENIKSEFLDKVNDLIAQANNAMQETTKFKNEFSTSSIAAIEEKVQLIETSPWLKNQQREELRNKLEKTKSTTLVNVENSTSRENMNNAMKQVEDEIADVQNSINKAEEDIKSAAKSDADNAKSSYEKAIEDDKSSFFSDDAALLKAKIQDPYNELVDDINNATSPEIIAEAQQIYNDKLDELNAEVEQYKAETQNLRNHTELISTQTQSNNEITVLKKDGKISDDTLNQNTQAIKSIVDAQIQYIAQAKNLEAAKAKNKSAIDAINNIVAKIKAQVSEWNVKWNPETPIEIDVVGSYTFGSKPELDDARAKQQKPDGPSYSFKNGPKGISIDWRSIDDETPVITLNDKLTVATYLLTINVKYNGIIDSGCETVKEYNIELKVKSTPVIKTGNLHVEEYTPDGSSVEYTYAPVLKSGQTFSSMGVSFYSSSDCSDGSKLEADTMAQLYGLEEENGTKYIGEPGLDLYYKIEPTANGLGGQLDDGKLYAIRAGVTHTWDEIYNAQTGQKGDNITSYELKDKLSSEKWIGLDWTDVSDGSTADIKVGNQIIATMGNADGAAEDPDVAESYGYSQGQSTGIFTSSCFLSCEALSFWGYSHAYCWNPVGNNFIMVSDPDESSEVIFSRAFVGSGTISGTVVDEKGKAISDAMALFGKTGAEVYTDADGKFSIPNVSGESDLFVGAENYGINTKHLNVESNVDVGKITLFPEGEIYITGKISFYDGSTWADHTPIEANIAFANLNDIKNVDMGTIDEKGNIVIKLTSATASEDRGLISVNLKDKDSMFMGICFEMDRPISFSVDLDITLYDELEPIRPDKGSRYLKLFGPTYKCTWGFLQSINSFALALDDSDSILNGIVDEKGQLQGYGKVFYKDAQTQESIYVKGEDVYNSAIQYYYETETVKNDVSLNLGEGHLKEGRTVPSGWTEQGSTKIYTAQFPYGTSYDNVLAGWDDVIDEATETKKLYWGITDSEGKSEGKLLKNTEFNAQYPNLNYQVCIWGIQQDIVDEKQTKASLSLGPATGKGSSCLEKACLNKGQGKRCFHEDTWEEIIEHAGDTNSEGESVYADCVENGCTKSVPILLNDIIGADNPSSRELCSILHSTQFGGHIKMDYVKWNYINGSSVKEAANWATSRIRATLNGYNNAWGGSFTPSEFASVDTCLKKDNCLLSCFPPRLVKAIKTKIYNVPTNWDSRSPFDITSYVTIKDKLWIPSAEEVYGNADADYLYYKEDWKEQYLKKYKEKTAWESGDSNIAYVGNGNKSQWWLHSPKRSENAQIAFVRDTGMVGNDTVANTACGLSPCFCL